MQHVFLIWKDARVNTNELHGVVELDEQELMELVADKFREKTGLNVAHIELRGMVTDENELFPNLNRFYLND